MYRYFLLICFVLSISLPCFGAAGDLDASFSQDGKVTTSFGTAYSAIAYDMFIQPDGKIVAVGTTQKISNPSISGIALARYNSDGTLDTTFGNSGKRSTFFSSKSALAFTGVLQNTNILVGGQLDGNFLLFRYTSAGVKDSTFGNNGKRTYSFSGSTANVTSIALQANGKIIVLGKLYKSLTNEFSFAMLRYSANGTLDTTFGTNGKVRSSAGFIPHAVKIQPDGKILVAASVCSASDCDMGVLRYNSDGTPDNTFDSDGETVDVAADAQESLAVGLKSNNRIIVAGYSEPAGTGPIGLRLVRFNTDGSLDIGFGTNGRVTTYNGGGLDIANALQIQSDDKIVTIGVSADSTGMERFSVIRYGSDGSPDSTFGSNGVVTTAFAHDSEAQAGKIQPDGKIVAAGFVNNGGHVNFALTRYLVN